MKAHTRKMTPRRRELLETAAKLFAKQGYAATTTRQLAKAAGMRSSASPFAHYRHKMELLRQIAIDTLRRLVVSAHSIGRRPSCPQQKMTALIRFHLYLLAEEDRPEYLAAWRNWRELSPASIRQARRLLAAYEACWRKCWREISTFTKEEALLAVRLMLYGLSGVADWPAKERNKRILEQTAKVAIRLFVDRLSSSSR